MLMQKSAVQSLKVEGVRKEWNGKSLFADVSFELFLGEKVALLGKNGTGKTTLLKAIMGHVTLDEGTVQHMIPLEEWGWLEQDLHVADNVSLIDFVKSGNLELADIARALSQLESQMSTSEVTPAVLDNYAILQQQYEVKGGYTFETEVEMSLTRLLLQKAVWDVPYAALSGGQKTRAQLARLMVRQPKGLILDEPTNHLDAQTLTWLADWLKQFDGTVLFVTHDRTLMDRVADAVLELKPDGCRRHKGGYSQFKAARELEMQTQTSLWEKQERERRDLMEAIRRYQQWYQQAHEAAGERNPFLKKRAMKNATRFKAKERELQRLESRSVERPRESATAMIEFEQRQFEARTLARLRNVRVTYQERVVLSGVTLDVERHHRIAILGRNGAGKTTLLQTLTGDVEAAGGDVTGEVMRHPELRIGYFEQELGRQDMQQTVLDTLLTVPGMTQSYARTILAGFLFRQEDVFKPLGVLSMGERCRAAFVQLYLSGANLLVLDEPTNYLDVDTRERVEEALLEYPGALILVTHDIYLIRKVANRIVAIEDGEVRVFDGSYDEFEQSRMTPVYQDRTTENRTRQLELLLAQLVGQDEPDTPEEKAALVRKIVATRRELDALRSLRDGK
ncbi:ATP-binding cassette domain-containing protein [Alicyclobacillus curvatus]|nr:ATP-binding cassette domain-containing protein [Alicyclobacillus curvatus]